MKAIRIEVEDELFDTISKDKDFQVMGVSGFFRAAVKFFPKWKTEYEIDKRYEQAYGDPRAREEHDREMKEWLDGQVWID